MNAEVVMNGLVAGKSYGIHAVFIPQTEAASFPLTITGLTNPIYTFSVSVNGFNLFTKTKTNTDLNTLDSGDLYE
jgi:hypothetical protein